MASWKEPSKSRAQDTSKEEPTGIQQQWLPSPNEKQLQSKERELLVASRRELSKATTVQRVDTGGPQDIQQKLSSSTNEEQLLSKEKNLQTAAAAKSTRARRVDREPQDIQHQLPLSPNKTVSKKMEDLRHRLAVPLESEDGNENSSKQWYESYIRQVGNYILNLKTVHSA